MSNWNPVKPMNIGGLFAFSEEYSVVKKSISNIEHQRAIDGTPITRTASSALAPAGPELRLNDFEQFNKSMAEKKDEEAKEKAKNKIDPAAVVKSYLAL